MSIQKIIKTPMTDADIEKYLGDNAHIIKYSELNNMNDIRDILPTDKSYMIILIESEINSGHWVCALRYKNTIEIFNSYGLKPSKRDFIRSSKYNKEFLNQDENNLKLNALLDKALNDNFNVIYNTSRFQRKRININTCGRHCILRIITMKYFDMDLERYIDFMQKAREMFNKDYDYIVSYIIN